MDNLIDSAKLTFSLFNIIMMDDFLKFVFFFGIGALGAMTKDIFEDNAFVLPKIIDGKLIFGSIGGAFVGGIAGYLIDSSLLSAFAAGYAGKSIIESLLNKVNVTQQPKNTEQKPVPQIGAENLEQMIRRIATDNKVDPELALRIAKCESGLNPQAVHINGTGSKDRGLYQWNDKYHPEISDDMAFNPEIATIKFCEAIRNGHLSWWDASKTCWNK